MAKANKVKCVLCGKSDSKDIMVKTEHSGRRYLHEDCAEEFENFKKGELEETKSKDSMYKLWAEVYGIQNYQDISSRIYAMFTNLRQGNPVFRGKSFDRRYREGFTYDVIERTIEDCRDKIDYANSTKDFESLSSAMFYGIKIVVDRIPAINRKVQREKASREVEEARALSAKVDEELMESVEEQQNTDRQNRTSNTVDISRFL